MLSSTVLFWGASNHAWVNNVDLNGLKSCVPSNFMSFDLEVWMTLFHRINRVRVSSSFPFCCDLDSWNLMLLSRWAQLDSRVSGADSSEIFQLGFKIQHLLCRGTYISISTHSDQDLVSLSTWVWFLVLRFIFQWLLLTRASQNSLWRANFCSSFTLDVWPPSRISFPHNVLQTLLLLAWSCTCR